MTTVAEMLAQALYDQGVRTVFGLPGGEVVEVLDALRRIGIEFVLVKNESSAIYMADVIARLTGTIGVAITTLGPGATNAYAGMAHAYLDRSPVLLITAQTDPTLIQSHTHQVLDLQACFAPVCKATYELEAQSAAETVHYALSQLIAGRTGPVHLGLCNRVALESTSPIDVKPQVSPSPDLASHSEAIQSILQGSQKPIIVVGVGLEPQRPYQQLQRFAEAWQAPLIDTPKSKGALSAQHPLFVGTIGLTRDDPAYDILDQADCIIAVGFDVVELVKPWSQSEALIWIAPWPNQAPELPAVHHYVGEIAPLLMMLSQSVHERDHKAWGQQIVRQYRERLSKRPLPVAINGHISPQDVLRIIGEETPDEIIMTTDVGAHKIFTALNWPAKLPNHYFVSNGLSAMGFGVPAAIAAAQVTGKPTICITGDGGLAMVVGELSLAVDAKLPVIIVMMNDQALDLIRSAQQRRHKPISGTVFVNPDYEKIAEGYRLAYYHVDNPVSCRDALQSAVSAAEPCLIDVQIDPAGYPTAVPS